MHMHVSQTFRRNSFAAKTAISPYHDGCKYLCRSGGYNSYHLHRLSRSISLTMYRQAYYQVVQLPSDGDFQDPIIPWTSESNSNHPRRLIIGLFDATST